MVIKNLNLAKKTEKAKEFYENQLAFTISPVELKKLIETNEEIRIIDVRKREHYLKSHIPKAISIPESDIGLHVNKLKNGYLNIIYSYTQNCHLATQSALVLAENNSPVMVLNGGFLTWRDEYEFNVMS